ncbi:unnamed protein product [Polarella glacialis]|uniref:Methyltransferase domain-containing protein n=1 Tax=Polarella glacialis TaxID=89957 RepID=A0A813GR55_POLGL|nr:unnamed protein product [Polarella glacialis]
MVGLAALLITSLVSAAARRDCWEGTPYSYDWCCGYPPHTRKFIHQCWKTLDVDDEFTYDKCCDIRFGADTRMLPAWWNASVSLQYALTEGPIIIHQARPPPLPIEAEAELLWGVAGGLVGGSSYDSKLRNDSHRLPFNAGILWNDKATRAMLSTDLLSQLRLLHGRDLQVLDLGSGLGLNVIGALRGGQVKLAVGVDFDPGAVLQAHRNAAQNGVRNFHFLQADICGSASELRARVRDQGVRGRVRFDVFTMTGMSAPLGS